MPRLLPIFCLLLASAAGAEELRRFAVIVGNDEGGAGTRPLLYARDDARRIASILQRLGGLRPEDTTVVLNGTADALLSSLADMERRVQDASRRGEHTALFLYYSGHAKDGALRLGDTALPFASLKSRLAQAPADIRIGIFDACHSGLMRAPRAPARRQSSRSRPTPRATPTAWSSSPPARPTRSRRSPTKSAGAISPTTWRAACWATPTARVTGG